MTLAETARQLWTRTIMEREAEMRIAIISALAVMLLSATAASAENSGEVSAQVTVAAPCITVGPNIDYGTLGFSTAVNAAMAQKPTSYTNCSTQAANVYVRGTNAASSSSSAAWELNVDSTSTCHEAEGPNVYNHYIWHPDDAFTTKLTLTDKLLKESAAAGVTQDVTTRIEMPCSGSDGAGETMTFSVVLTASF